MNRDHYIIRGGVEGRERLRVLSRVMRPTTLGRLDHVGVGVGMTCLDVGCGGGDVAIDLARLVGPTGKVVGIDIDERGLELAAREIEAQQLAQVELRLADVTSIEAEAEFDLVYARFLLTHLKDPADAIRRIRRLLKPGGALVVEDIDFRGHFCHPDSAALGRYVDLYTQAARRRGGDPHIGPRLPGLLMEAGFHGVEAAVVQPAGVAGDVKLVAPITMESIAPAVIAEQLASEEEVQGIVAELHAFARRRDTFVSLPRIVQAWGRSSAG
jgi:ubiquinone/menaquinone biosynthesis C-methylase UbiE